MHLKMRYISPEFLNIAISFVPCQFFYIHHFIIITSKVKKNLVLMKSSIALCLILACIYLDTVSSEGCLQLSHKAAGNLCGYVFKKKGVILLL